MVSACAVGYFGSLQVTVLVAVVLWSGLRGLKISPHLIFILETFEDNGVPGESAKYGPPKRRH